MASIEEFVSDKEKVSNEEKSSDEDVSHTDLADFLESDLIKFDELEENNYTAPLDEKKDVADDINSLNASSDILTNSKNEELDSNGSRKVLRKGRSSKYQKLNSSYSSRLTQLPSELHYHILKFLSPEDLSTCSSVCRFLRMTASDDMLWRKGYCLRWGAPKDRKGKQGTIPWKQLYFDKDKSDMREFVYDIETNTPEELRQYFIQIQTAKRSITPTLKQINDDLITVASTVAQEVMEWRRIHGFSESSSMASCSDDHVCDGSVCSFHQIDDVFLCEQSGKAHVCDENCRETFFDSDTQLLVCSISGHCFDSLFSAEEEEYSSLKAAGALSAEEFEPLMGAGRLGRAFWLGYNCDDEKELLETQKYMGIL